MPDYKTPETVLIARQTAEATHRNRPPVRRWPASPRATAPKRRAPSPPPPLRRAGVLSARGLRVSLTLEAGELLAVAAPHGGRARVPLRISLQGRVVTADVAAKSVRKAQAAIRQRGADGVALLLQGRLADGDTIAEEGLAVQLKTTKPRQAP